MPFLFLGVILLIVSVVLLRKGLRSQDKEMIIGMEALLIASVIMILLFGIFYNVIVP